MSKSMNFTIAILAFCLYACNGNTIKEASKADDSFDTLSVTENNNAVSVDTIPLYAQKIINAYPDFGLKYESGYLIFTDGTKITCDDGKEKNFVEKLDNCDIEDMFSMKYDSTTTTPSYLNDCGRGRNEELFKKMYGSSELAARKNLVSIEWFGQKIPFTMVNGAAEQLKKVASELQKCLSTESILRMHLHFIGEK